MKKLTPSLRAPADMHYSAQMTLVRGGEGSRGEPHPENLPSQPKFRDSLEWRKGAVATTAVISTSKLHFLDVEIRGLATAVMHTVGDCCTSQEGKCRDTNIASGPGR
jgi:hypothetical protein